MNNLDTLDHIAIQVNSIQDSLHWYLKKFQCEEIYSDRTWALIRFKNINLALVSKSEHPPHFAVLDRAISMSPDTSKHRDGSISKYIQDNSNNYIELINYEL